MADSEKTGGELLTIKEVAEKVKAGDPQFAEFAKELRTAAANFQAEDRGFDCRVCGKRYVPSKGQWIFYNLCTGCFAEFDFQKMRGRFREFPIAISPNSDPEAAAHIRAMIDRFGGGSAEEFYTESCDEWLRSKKESQK